jgi:integrase
VLALSTGARKGELSSLTWDAVDLRRSLLTFHDLRHSAASYPAMRGLHPFHHDNMRL